jgi:hypothetical protein
MDRITDVVRTMLVKIHFLMSSCSYIYRVSREECKKLRECSLC